MTRLRLILQSLWHHRRTHLPVLLAVAVATAVLTGALIVGDSVRESLKNLALERLGKIDQVLVGDRFISQDHAKKFAGDGEIASACIVAQATVETSGNQKLSRVRGVSLIGFDENFWQLNVPPQELDGVVINQALADELNIMLGDKITLRLPDANQVQADSALGQKDDRIRSLASLPITAIIPNQGLGKFSLRPTQQTTFNAFVPIELVQKALDVEGRANAMFVHSKDSPDKFAAKSLDLQLEDFGVTVERATQSFKDEMVFDYFHIVSDRMIWESPLRDAISGYVESLGGQEVFTYLANSIEKSGSDGESLTGRPVPYSTVTAVDFAMLFGFDGVAKNESQSPYPIVLNSWAAEQLDAKIGGNIQIKFFEPETTHGQAKEAAASFKVSRIVPLTEPAKPFRRRRSAEFSEMPTRANDPNLTPTVEGVTDQQAISDWDPPFPFDSQRIQPADDEYWENHRTTPKAYIPLAAGKEIWASRFGANTSFIVPTSKVYLGDLKRELTKQLRANQSQIGFVFRPIRAEALSASKGTTPFEFLFIGFSFFLIASALALIAILFRLGLDLRLKELGTLSAVGWTSRDIRNLSLLETAIVAGIGSIAGVALGVWYASRMLHGLRTWWIDAVVTPFMRMHVAPSTLLVGLLCGLLTALAVVWFSLRGLKKVNTTRLLTGRSSDVETASNVGGRMSKAPKVLAVLAVIMIVAAQFASGEAQAGLFFGGGAAILTAILLWLRRSLRKSGSTAQSNLQLSDVGLAWRSAARNPGRSTLTVSLMAAATFLIVAIGAFRIAPTESGTGGFELIAESDRALHYDFFDEATRTELFGDQAALLNGTDILGIRVHGGDDASCRNLYQATQPRLLGISRQMIDYFDDHVDKFAWSGTSSGTWNPWRCLDDEPKEVAENSGGGASEAVRSRAEPRNENPIPVIIDKNTAMYALHLPPKIGYEFELTYDDRPFRFRIAGLLGNTVLQGALLMSEESLVRVAPGNAGYRMFLIGNTQNLTNEPDEAFSNQEMPSDEVNTLLEQRFGDEGLDVKRTDVVLKDLLAVQNTYLSTFQSLGALGLLLGTLGLAAVQIRNVVSRRGEMGLLAAIGFSSIKLKKQIFLENFTLLLAGLGIGVLAALVTVIPHWIAGSASLPVGSLLMTLFSILAAGTLAGIAASFFHGSGRVIGALRSD